MPLTPEEIHFLGPALAEYHDLRVGPAWQQLHALGLLYPDVVWLMEAYLAVDPPRIERTVTADGTPAEILAFGRNPESVPECPWADADRARHRNQQLEIEVQAFRAAQAETRSP